MYHYSRSSELKLQTAQPLLQKLFREVLNYRDHTIAWGYRGEQIQNSLYHRGKSKLRFPQSDHNVFPSKAVDAYPFIARAVSYDREQCIQFAGFVQGIAARMRINLGWGGDWDNDLNLKEHSLSDLGHFYLIGGPSDWVIK